MRYWLVVLSGLILGIGFGMIQRETTGHGAGTDRRGLRYLRVQTAALASELRSYEQSHEQYPTGDEGLWSVSDAMRRRVEKDRKRIGKLARCRITASGVLSWWGDPVIYENRRDWSPRALAWSGGYSDSRHAYSHQVDTGVYLWSVGARQAFVRELARPRRCTVIAIATLIVCATLLAAFVLTALRQYQEASVCRRDFQAVYYTFFALLVAFAVALVPAILVMGYGCPGMQTPRTPELTRDYTATMRSYKDHGVISSDVFDRVVAALKQDEKDRLYYRY